MHSLFDPAALPGECQWRCRRLITGGRQLPDADRAARDQKGHSGALEVRTVVTTASTCVAVGALALARG